MAAPSGSAPTPPAGTPTAQGPVPDESLRALLSIARSLALVFALLAGLLFLIFLAFAFLDLVLRRGAGDVVTSVYCLASAAFNFVLWREIPRLQQLAAARNYAALRRQTLVWAVLGIIFFVVVGVVLLVAWMRAEMLASPSPA